MANNLNRVCIYGNMTKDPEVTYLPSGAATATVRIACNRSRKVDDQWVEETDFVPVKFIGKSAETVGTHGEKGLACYIEGGFRTDEWEKDDVKKFFSYVFGFTFIPAKWKPKQENQAAAPGKQPDFDDDIPF